MAQEDELALASALIEARTTTPDDEAQRSEAGVVIEGREGPVVATRNLGAGLVTVIGLDLRNRALGGGSDLRADQFWHRLFSQRFLIPGVSKYAQPAPQAERFCSISGVCRCTPPTP